jgi:hypothetical protein
MPVVGSQTSQNYPTLDAILNLVRALANDSFAGNTGTPGEGQVLTDLYQASTSYNPQVLNAFNSAIREMYRKLRNVKAKALIRDNYILTALPPVNGPLGASMPDPTVQTYLTFAYYFDGSVQQTAFTLPTDLLMPLRMWERQSGVTDPLVPMTEATNGLDASDQTDELREWEWREGRINFHGALIARDVRLKYLCFLPQFFPSNPVASGYFVNTQIPIFDCEETVAWLTLKNLTTGLNPAMMQFCKAEATEALYDLKNAEVRRMQSTDYHRTEFDDFQTGEALDEYSI